MHELRNALLATYLDGEPASVAILNDYLLELGEAPGQLHGNADRRMRVVLGLIPPGLSHLLGCDYAEHVVDLFRAAHPRDVRVREVIKWKRRWAQGKATDDQLKAARRGAWSAFEDAQRDARGGPLAWLTIGPPHGDYRHAACHAARAAFYASTHSDHTARDCCGEVARTARAAPPDAGRNEITEIAWQRERLRELLQRVDG